MNDLLKLHKTVGGNGLNKLTYREYLDEHFNLGELKDVIVEDNKLKVMPNCLAYYPFTEDLKDKTNKTTLVDSVGTLSIDPNEKALKLTSNKALLKNLKKAGLNKFTVEYMWKPTNSNFSGCLYIWSLVHSLHPLSTNGVNLGFWDGTNRISSIIPTLNTWCHQMYTYDNGVNKLYHNGELITTWSATKTFANEDMVLFSHQSNANYNQGYVKHLKFYDEVLTEPTYDTLPLATGHRISPPIELPKNVVSSKIDWEGEGKISILPTQVNSTDHLLDPNYCTLHLDGETLKNTMNLNTVVNEVGSVSTTEGLFSKKAYVIDGNTDYIQIPNESNNVGLFEDSDFTIDFWLKDKYTDYVNSSIYLGIWAGDDAQSQWAITRGTSQGGIRFICRNSASSNTLIWNSSGNLIPDDKWCHIAVMRKKSTLIVTVNGKVAIRENNFTGNFSPTSTSPLLVGRTSHSTGLYPTKCFIQEIRIHKKAIWSDLNVIPPILPSKLLEYTDVNKGESLTLGNPYLRIKQEVKGEETISNVKLELKYKPKKEYIRPSDLKEEIPSKLVLYNNGDECDKVTGGWKGHQWDTSFKNGYFSKKDTYLEYGDNTSNYGYGGFVTNSGIDLTPYSTLYVDFQFVSYSASGYSAFHKICVCQDNTPTIRNQKFDYVHSVSNAPGRYQVEIDVSNYNGIYYLGVQGQSGSYNNHTNIQRLYYMELRK